MTPNANGSRRRALSGLYLSQGGRSVGITVDITAEKGRRVVDPFITDARTGYPGAEPDRWPGHAERGWLQASTYERSVGGFDEEAVPSQAFQRGVTQIAGEPQ